MDTSTVTAATPAVTPATCEPTLDAASLPWYRWPTTAEGWTELAAQLAEVGGGVAAARRDAIEMAAGVLVAPVKRRVQGRRGARALYPAHVPRGLLSELPAYSLDVFRAAALDIIDQLSELDVDDDDGGEFLCMNAEANRQRYGRPMVNGQRHWTWDLVSVDLFRRGIIELEASATSTATYVPEASSMSYRLTARWRHVVGVELVERPAALWVAEPVNDPPTREDGSPVEVPSFYDRCARDVGFDLEAAQRHILGTYGASEPETFEFAELERAILESTAPPEVLADCEASRRVRPIGEDPTKPTWERGRLIDENGEFVKDERSQRDDRPVEDIARGCALARLKHLQRWRVEGVCRLKRDRAGWRLHSPVTRLASELRQFLSFNGEPLVGIDCKNSQMTLLATFALEVSNGARDAVEFAEVCGAGRFYEEAFTTVYGRHPSPEERNAFKRKSMGAWLYAHRGVQRNADLALKLAARWPSVHAAMLDAKAKRTRDLPCAMQRREAHLWIDTLAPMLERIGCPGVTAHDSVYVPASRRDEVLTLLQSIYAVAGVRATFA